MKLPTLLCLLAIFPAFSHAEEKDDGDWDFLKSRLPDEKTMETFVRNRQKTNTFRFAPAALRFIEGTEKIVVFEGMPHHTWEPELLKQELERIEETIIGEFPFYPQPKVFLEKDEPALRELLRDAKGLGPYLYNYMCGGFHPDYTIRFTRGDVHCDLLICFGCGGARILHDGRVIDCHIFNGWKDLLAGYAKQRPKSER